MTDTLRDEPGESLPDYLTRAGLGAGSGDPAVITGIAARFTRSPAEPVYGSTLDIHWG